MSDNKYFQGQNNALSKGEEVNLLQKDATLRECMIAVGWDIRTFEGDPVDLDVCCFLLNKADQTRENEDFIFYNNPKGCSGAVRHTGDSRTGAGDGDDETIYFDLNGLPFDVAKAVFVLSIYNGEEREHHFGMVRNTYLRVVNHESGDEIVRYDLTPELEQSSPSATAMVVAEIVREGPKWHFRAVGEPVEGGLARIATNYGIVVQEMIGT